METKLTDEELTLLKQLFSAKRLSAMQAELDEAKYANVILSLRLKYSLSETDSVDINTGLIKRI